MLLSSFQRQLTLMSVILLLSFSTIAKSEPKALASVGLDFMDFDRATKAESSLMGTLSVGGAFNRFFEVEGKVGLNVLDLINGDTPYVPNYGTQFSAFKFSALGRFNIPLRSLVSPFFTAGWEYTTLATSRLCYSEEKLETTPGGLVTTRKERVCPRSFVSHSGFVYGGGIRFGDSKGGVSLEYLKNPQNDNGFGYSLFTLRFTSSY